LKFLSEKYIILYECVKCLYNINVIITEELKNMEAIVLKVSAKSNPNLVAGALSGTIKESGIAELQAIGAGAINQAIKAVAITRNILPDVDLICIPYFADLTIDDQIRTSIKLVVEPR